MSSEALVVRLSGFGVDGDAFIAGAATAALLLVLVVAAIAYQRERRHAAAREARRHGEESSLRRIKDLEELRVRLVALERQAEETRQALVARAALDAAGPPSAGPPSAAPVLPVPAPAVDAAARPRALVCSADGALARVFESLLKTRGFEAERCADGIDAAALAARRPPVLAVLDLAATGSDGAAIVRAVRVQLARGGRLFVLAHDTAEAVRAGVGDAERLLKPVDFVAVARLIRGGAAQGVKR